MTDQITPTVDAEPAVQDGAPPVVDAQLAATDTPAADPPSVEDRALERGWRPIDQWRGDQEAWVDAEEFVRRSEIVLPIVRSRAEKAEAEQRRLNDEVDSLRKAQAASEAQIKDVIEQAARQRREGYESAKRELEEAKRQAVSDGDVDRYDALAKREADLPPPPSEPAKDATPPAPDQDPAWLSWKSENTWYESDPQLHAMADGMGQMLAAENESRQQAGQPLIAEAGTAFFDEVKRRVREAMPHKFTNPARTGPAPVDAGGGTGGKNRGRKSYNDLPADAKAVCDRMCGKNESMRKTYVTTYFEQE